MGVNTRFERSLKYVCFMFIKYEVSKLDRSERPSATDSLKFAMGKTGIKKLDIGNLAYKSIRKRTRKRLDKLPSKGTGTKTERALVKKRVAAMKAKVDGKKAVA